MDGVAFHDPMHEATKKPLTTVAACHCSPYSPGRQSRPHLFHVVRKVCTKSGHVSTIPPVVKNNSHHGISTIKSDYPIFGIIFVLIGTVFSLWSILTLNLDVVGTWAESASRRKEAPKEKLNVLIGIVMIVVGSVLQVIGTVLSS